MERGGGEEEQEGDSENGREAPASPGEIHLIGGKSTVVSISATYSTRQSQSQSRHALRDAMVGAASPAPPRRSTAQASNVKVKYTIHLEGRGTEGWPFQWAIFSVETSQ